MTAITENSIPVTARNTRDEMIAVGRDLITIPFIGLERVRARRLRRSDNGAGVVPGRLLPPDLHLVAAAFLR